MTEPAEQSDVVPESGADSREAGRYPVNYVLGVVATNEAAAATLNELTSQGFLDSEVGAMCGPDAAETLEATTGRKGLANLAMKVGEWIGVSNAEMEVKERYEQALRDHQFVVGALALDDERKRRASEIIASHGGHFIHFFNRFSIEVIRR